MTSHTHPLAIARIDCNVLGAAKLGFSSCPGKKIKNWRRSLALDVHAIKKAGVECITVLLPEEELEEMELPDYLSVSANPSLLFIFDLFQIARK